jgi:hypothetical protein
MADANSIIVRALEKELSVMAEGIATALYHVGKMHPAGHSDVPYYQRASEAIELLRVAQYEYDLVADALQKAREGVS